MNPGLELDVLVAEKVMGQAIPREGFPASHRPTFPGAYYLPAYSTDIAAAWEVVEKLQSMQAEASLLMIKNPVVKTCRVRFMTENAEIAGHSQEQSMPHAICLAALKAVGWPERGSAEWIKQGGDPYDPSAKSGWPRRAP
jgi:hypothetical protein